jgi:lipopolysaccharide assembly outer membrane protein LptD (OstA)
MAPKDLSLEFGYQYSFSNSNQAPNLHNLPLSYFRYGVANKLEVNLSWSGFESSTKSNGINASNGFGLGAKYRIVEAERYNFSLLGKMSIEGLSDNIELRPLVAGLWDYSLNSKFGAFGNLNLAFSNSQNLYSEVSLGISYSLHNQISIIGEYYNNITFDQMAVGHNLGFGLIYLVNEDLQLDLNFGSGLDSNNYHFFGIGLSKRL